MVVASRRTEILLSAIGILSLFLIMVSRYWDVWALDLSALYYAGWFYGTGEHSLIYTSTPYSISSTSAEEAGRHSALGLEIPQFLYPPIWLEILAPIAHNLLPQTFFNYALILNSLFCCGIILLAWSLIDREDSSFFLYIGAALIISLYMKAVMLGLFLGQPQILIIFLILLAFCVADRPWMAGGLIGLAAAIKITPILFAIIFLASGRVKAGFIAVGVSVFFALLSVILTGWPLHAAYLEVARETRSVVGVLNASSSMVSLVAYAADLPAIRVVDTPAGIVRTLEKPLWLGIGATLAWIIGAGVLLSLSKRHPDALAIRLAGFSALIPLFAAVSWTHYLILPLFLGLALAASISNRAVLVYTVVSALILWDWPTTVMGEGLEDISRTIRQVFWLLLLYGFALVITRYRPSRQSTLSG